MSNLICCGADAHGKYHPSQVSPASFPAIGTAESALLQRQPRTYWGMVRDNLRHDKLTLAALAFLLALALLAALAAVISQAVGVGPNDTNPDNALVQPYLWPFLQCIWGLMSQQRPTCCACSTADGSA